MLLIVNICMILTFIDDNETQFDDLFIYLFIYFFNPLPFGEEEFILRALFVIHEFKLLNMDLLVVNFLFTSYPVSVLASFSLIK